MQACVNTAVRDSLILRWLLTVAAKLAVPFIPVILFHTCIGRITHKFLTTLLADPFPPTTTTSGRVQDHLSLVSCTVFADLKILACISIY